MAPLLPLRRAVTSGVGDVEKIASSIDRRQGRGAIVDLWRSQANLARGDRKGAAELFAAFPSPSDRPLAEILRGRLAVAEGDEVAAAVAFEHAINLGPGRDALWLELAAALSRLDGLERAAPILGRAAKIGSRNADVYYDLAAFVAQDDEDEAERYLQTAWSLRPVRRDQLLTTDSFWSLLRRSTVHSLIGFSAPGEKLVGSGTTAAQPIAVPQPIALPQPSVAETSGDFLRVAVGDSHLLVPGGATLAPAGSRVVAADEWQTAEEERLVEGAPSLIARNNGVAAYAQPALSLRLVGTAEALAANNRWSEVVTLTEAAAQSIDHVPSEILLLRSVGLRRLERREESRRLLTQLASSAALQRTRDAMLYVNLAELLASEELFDLAVATYNRAQAIRPLPFIDDRVRQILTEKRLATKYSIERTRNFEVHYPEEISQPSAALIGAALERELARLQEWIPVPTLSPVIVNVLSWQEFRSTFTGSDFILGFYNGRITVPFAEVSIDHPAILAILSHELAHAMIAQATRDHAPKWFHEGLAQRIEQRPYHANAFNMYEDDKLLPVAVLDAVLRGSSDPQMIGAAYVVAQTDIRYIEAKYGRAGIRTLLGAFRDGATTATAIERLGGRNLEAFELDLRQWGRSERRVFENARAQ